MSSSRLRIHGTVQGVCYRDWAVRTARSLQLDGWVRNRMDGTVEVVLSGEPQAIAHFVALAHEGPPAAHVTRIDQYPEPEQSLSGFDFRPTE